jgi:hypothetical protein
LNRVSDLCPSQPGLLFFYLQFPCCWDDRSTPPHPAFYCGDEGLTSYLDSWSWTSILPFASFHTWYCRREPSLAIVSSQTLSVLSLSCICFCIAVVYVSVPHRVPYFS